VVEDAQEIHETPLSSVDISSLHGDTWDDAELGPVMEFLSREHSCTRWLA
jgi:hypothetical protein